MPDPVPNLNAPATDRVDRQLLLGLIGLALVLIPLLVRTQGTLIPLPWWDGDPLRSMGYDAISGFTGSWSLLFDAVVLVGAGVLLWNAPATTTPMWMTVVLVLLACVGTISVVHHGWSGVDADAGNVQKARADGAAWVSGIFAMFALWRASADRRVAVVATAIVAGFAMMLLCKGAMQFLIEHPAMVAKFRAEKAQVLAEHGWTPDSPMARGYERRIMQAEASGWFGFANVYATFAAMGLAACVAMARAAQAGGTRRSAMVMLAGAFACGLGVALAGAKGGYVIGVLGVVLVPMVWWIAGKKKTSPGAWAYPIMPALVVCALLGVVARGLIGERIGELSVLFRWFYMQGAARVFGAHPLWGVGPEGFQDAYSIFKPPLSPENVSSPHSIFFDWLACLGLFGIAWIVLTLTLAWRAGGCIRRETSDIGGTRMLMRVTALIATASVVVAVPFQYATLLIEEAIFVRLLGLGLWCVVSCVMIGIAGRSAWWRVTPMIIAAVMLVHSQIELTGVLTPSCGLVLAMVGLAAGVGERVGERINPTPCPSPLERGVLSAVPVCLGAGCFVFGMMPARTWERRLTEAWNELGASVPIRVALDEEFKRGGSEVAGLRSRLFAEEAASIPHAILKLPRSWPLARNRSQLAGAWAQRLEYLGSPTLAQASMHAAYDLVNEPIRGETLVQSIDAAFKRHASTIEPPLAKEPPPMSAQPFTVTQHGWLATIAEMIARTEQSPAWLRRAADHLDKARLLDPYSPVHPSRLADLRAALGEPAAARDAARAALANHELQRLDRDVNGLDDRTRSRMKQLAAWKEKP